MATAILRFEDCPELHARLARVLGKPSACFVAGEPKKGKSGEQWASSLWTLESPNTRRSVEKQLEWAAEIVREHQRFIRSLVRNSMKVTLHLACHGADGFTLFVMSPHLLEPFAKTGIPIEICVMV